MTFWDFFHAHPMLFLLGGFGVLICAGLAFIAVEDAFIQWRNIEKIRAISKKDGTR
jgi:hypothetical protein